MTQDNNLPWLTIIGIGEAGLDELSDFGWSLIAEAEHLFGGLRHLSMVPDTFCQGATRRTWPSPFSEVFSVLEKLRGQRVVILASGDPMEFGIGGSLARQFDWREIRVLSSPSSFSLAANRLGWPLDGTSRLTIHGRDPASLLPHYLPGARLLILSKDGDSPILVAHQLCEHGLGDAFVAVLEHLGGDEEKIIESTASLLHEGGNALRFSDLNLLAAQLPERFTGWLPTLAGLPDDAFEHDGKMTKRDVRASALAKLAPYPGALLWDVGTGCGSVAIEWLRMHPSCRAVGIDMQKKTACLCRSQCANTRRSRFAFD